MRHNPSIDRLSSLDDDLLHYIIMRLPANNMVATGILSRRWRNLWHSTFGIWLEDSYFPSPENNHFMDFNDRVLSLSNSSSLIRFKLILHHPCDITRVKHWVNFATDHNVQFLQIIIRREVFPPKQRFPLSFIFHLQSLKNLIIFIPKCDSICWPSNASFPVLEYLHLCEFKFKNTARDAISKSCPRLRTLKMWRCFGFARLTVCCPYLEVFSMGYCYKFHDLIISCPRLEQFIMKYTFGRVTDAANLSFGILAPSLIFFQWIDRPLIHFRNVEMPSVMHSFVRLKSADEGELLLSLSKIRQLSIDCISIVNTFIQEIDHSSLYQNVQILKLLVNFDVVKFVATICNALRCFPNLSTLEINTESTTDIPNTVFDVSVDSGKNCNMYQLSLQLQKLVQVEVHQFRGTPCEIELIKIILEVASSLQRITIKTLSNSMTCNPSVVAEELSKLPSASTNLRFIFLQI